MTLQHIINIDGIESYADNSLLLSAAVLSAYYANISTKRTENLDMYGICVNTHSHLTSVARKFINSNKICKGGNSFFHGSFPPFSVSVPHVSPNLNPLKP